MFNFRTSPKVQRRVILTSFVILNFLLLSSNSLAQFAGGSGTQIDPYQISTLEQLQNMKNNLGANFILINDINASATDTMNSGDGFEPIGSGITNSFSGSFNGQLFTIDSLFIDRSSYVGLFGYIENATISNVRLTNVDTKGISSTGTIVGESRFGTLINVSVTGKVQGNTATGGLIGRSLGNISNSFADVRVSGNTYSGGIVGRGSPNISNSYALGNVSASNRDAGGLIALSGGVITNSYSKGTVTSGGTKGGLVGSTSGSGANVVNSFWDTETSGLLNSAGGEGKTSSEMKETYTYQQGNWDLYSVWVSLPDSNAGYPFLRVFEDYQVSANAPVASNLIISGAIEVDSTLTLSYDYFDADGDSEYISEVHWYRATDISGTNRTIIEGATNTTYTITGADRAHFVGVEITPHDLTSAGLSVEEFTSTSVTSIFAGGFGSEEDPFQIETLDQLQNINTGLESYYVLNNDISASNTSTWNGGSGFIPLGNDSVSFSGGFDGANFTIDGLFIDRTSEDMIGLFGVTSLTAKISNIQLADADLKGQLQVGVLVGKNNGSISESSASGIVQGGNAIGGLVGSNNQGIIMNSYANVHVTGNNQSGGLIGLNEGGTITQSYSIGLVDNGTSTIGGLVGEANGGSITNSYWDSQTSGQETSAGGTIKTTLQMKEVATFSTWQLKTIWGLHPNYNTGYPFLRTFETPTSNAPVVSNLSITGAIDVENTLSVSYSFFDEDEDPEYLSEIQWYRSKDNMGAERELIENADSTSYVIQESDKAFFLSVSVTPSDVFNQGTPVEVFASQVVPSDLYAGGFGTESFPFQIADLDQLQAMNMNHNAHFELITNIDATATENWNSGAGFVPIAGGFGRFTGSLNGNGFEIDGLFINKPEEDNIGLFGTIREGEVSNIGLINVNITGNRNVGGLTGDLDGNSITNAFVTGTVTGDSNVGGLIGSSFSATVVRDSYSTATVSGRSDIGGLIGRSYITLISCYATGDVTSTSLYSGGLVGSNRGSIIKSYSTGNVDGNNTSGGLVGYNRGPIENSFATGNVHSTFSAAGFVGSNDTTITNSYAIGSVTSNFTPAGFIASAQSGSEITSSFWDKEASGVNSAVDNGSSVGITGVTTAQMYQRSTYINWDFATIWGIDEGTGYPFLQESNFNTLTINGDEGWRMLASPVEGATLDSLLGNIRTQGFSGANVTADSSNVYLWNASTQNWEVPSSMSQPLANGQGFAVYVFADDDNDGTPETFPKQLHTTLTQYIGTTDAGLSHSADSGWNLVGNPYAETIDWDAPNGWTKNNISNTFYVWSDSAGGGQGAYLTWNGVTGTLYDGKIAPWQGFWTKATAENPELIFTDSLKASGGIFRKEKPVSKLDITLSNEQGFYSTTTILFMDENKASNNIDVYDSYALASLNDVNLSVSTSFDNEPAMKIQALPYVQGTINLNLLIEAINVWPEMVISWEGMNLPPLVDLELFDNDNNTNFDLTENGSYSMINDTISYQVFDLPKKPRSPFHKLQGNQSEPSRFTISLDGTALSNDLELEIPTSVELQQNYPNPFNPSTSIEFGVPETEEVTLEVFDILGRKVATLLNAQRKTPGRYTLNFNASNLASGMYIYRLAAGNSIITKKLTLIK